jgi:hypothetical protein
VKSYSFDELLDFHRESLGETGARDLFMAWFEESTSMIRDRRWTWNWTTKSFLTLANETNGATFIWSIGDDFIETSDASNVTLNTLNTGRGVMIGDEWYAVTDVGLKDPTRVYLDREIHTSEVDGADLIFVRREYCVRTTRIRGVSCGDRPKLIRLDLDSDFHNKMHGAAFDLYLSGTPNAYIDNDSVLLAEPAYPPKVTSSGGGAFTNGDYIYFFTKYDKESELESKPGPQIRVSISDGFRPIVIYDNDVDPNQLESTTYKLRLYRSEVNPESDRCPMYLVDEREAVAPAPGGEYVDTDPRSNGLLLNKIPYWDGPYCSVMLVPPPSGDRERLRIDHLNNWYYRPNLRDRISCGVDNQVIELMRMHMTGLVSLQARDPKEQRAAMFAFRRQIDYLVTKDEKSGETDVSLSSVGVSDNPYENNDDSSWVDKLRWRD